MRRHRSVFVRCDLEELNPHPGTATNAMCTFLALNTNSVQSIPTTAILVAAGSTNPTAIVGTSLLATLCAATVAITAVKLLEKLPFFRVTPNEIAIQRESALKTAAVPTAAEVVSDRPASILPRWGPLSSGWL